MISESFQINKSEDYLGRIIVIFCICVTFFHVGFHLSNINFCYPLGMVPMLLLFPNGERIGEEEVWAVGSCAALSPARLVFFWAYIPIESEGMNTLGVYLYLVFSFILTFF